MSANTGDAFESAECESARQINALHSRINNQRDTIQAQSAELKSLRALLRRFYDFVSTAPVSSDVCCCGGSMESHFAADHSAVDMWTDSIQRGWKNEIDAALTAERTKDSTK